MTRDQIDALTQDSVERAGLDWAAEFFRQYGCAGAQVVDTAMTSQPAYWQREIGDFIVRRGDGVWAMVEVKTERRHTGNLFLETWSNRCTDNEWRRDGWMFTLKADTVLFFFLDAACCYSVPLRGLREWALEHGNLYRYPERTVWMSRNGRQRNNTVGHPVPVADLRRGRLVSEFRRTEPGTWEPAAGDDS